jgi:GNAT superfamily N-acetyltransferase
LSSKFFGGKRMMLMTDIHVRSFTGAGLKPYLHSVAKLRTEVFREYPYFEEPDLDRETKYLRRLSSCKESIGVLIFDNTTLVGASLGHPLAIEEASLHRPFKEQNLEIESYFFFGDSSLLKAYRGRGIGHHFFDARESHVAHYKKFKHICFCVPDCLELDPQRPKDFIPLHDFWRKRGYTQHTEMKCTPYWKGVGEAHSTEKQMNFWIKEIH